MYSQPRGWILLNSVFQTKITVLRDQTHSVVCKNTAWWTKTPQKKRNFMHVRLSFCIRTGPFFSGMIKSIEVWIVTTVNKAKEIPLTWPLQPQHTTLQIPKMWMWEITHIHVSLYVFNQKKNVFSSRFSQTLTSMPKRLQSSSKPPWKDLVSDSYLIMSLL